ncbi:MAG: hypothetical protein K2J37_00930 [Ruminococcus sp.]|nr:hypothetical protein [Ruminococcus sp.]
MKGNNFDWDRIIEDAFSDGESHEFSESYRLRKQQIERSINMKRKFNKRRIIGMSVAVALTAAGCTGILAAGKFGIFEKLSNNLDSVYVDSEGNEYKKDKFENHDFEQIAQAAQPFTDPIPLDGKDISVSVESMYCDGNTLILGLSGSLRNGNPDGFQYIRFTPYLTMNDKKYGLDSIHSNGIINGRAMLYLDEGTQNSFTGHFQITLNNWSKISQPTDIEFKFLQFSPNSNHYGIGEKDDEILSDEFNFAVNVTPDESLKRHINHTFTDSEGYSLTIFDITPAGMEIQCWQIPEVYDHETPYQKANPDSKVYCIYTDGDGNNLEFLGLWSTFEREDGSLMDLLQPPKSDIINVKYYDANTPDENGESLFVHEMTIDLENLTVIE